MGLKGQDLMGKRPPGFGLHTPASRPGPAREPLPLDCERGQQGRAASPPASRLCLASLEAMCCSHPTPRGAWPWPPRLRTARDDPASEWAPEQQVLCQGGRTGGVTGGRPRTLPQHGRGLGRSPHHKKQPGRPRQATGQPAFLAGGGAPWRASPAGATLPRQPCVLGPPERSPLQAQAGGSAHQSWHPPAPKMAGETGLGAAGLWGAGGSLGSPICTRAAGPSATAVQPEPALGSVRVLCYDDLDTCRSGSHQWAVG